MVKRRFSKHVLRALGLITLGAVLFIVAPGNRVVMVPIPSPMASPTPVPTPEVKGRNPLGRFFSKVLHPIARVFRRSDAEGPGCYLPPLVTITSSSASITICPPGWSPAPSCSASREVTLTAGPFDKDDKLLFTWSVTAGLVRGEGSKVTWDLSGVAEGTYTATVEANAGNQLTSMDSTTVKVAACRDCVTMESPCPTCWVICRSSVVSKLPATFEANVAGGDITSTPTYEWSLSAGKIISGQGTSKISVDVSDLAGKSLTATVNVGGFDPGCMERKITIASCKTEVGQ